MPIADNAVDRPLVDVVIDAIDADNDLSEEAKRYVLVALRRLTEPYDDVSTPNILRDRHG